MSVPKKIPKHVAIIMDGNGRWAQRRGHSRIFGHVRGASRVKPIVLEADRLGVRALTLFAFSTENWGRPQTELGVLWKLLRKYLIHEADNLHRNNVRLQVMGEIERLDPDVRAVLDPAIEKLSKNTGLLLTFAVSYGSRTELTQAARRVADDCLSGKLKPDEITESLMWKYLWSRCLADLAEVDLVIRTSGEKRISNFLLWQAAYAEYVFFDFYWPDFIPDHLRLAFDEFSIRNRRFGKIESPLYYKNFFDHHPVA